MNSLVRNFIPIFLATLIMTLVISGAMFIRADDRDPNANPENKIYVRIESGMDARSIAEMVARHGIIRSKVKFIALAKINRYEDKFRVGVYDLYPGMSTQEVLDRLTSGETLTLKFTIPEGFTVKDIAKRLDKMEIVHEDEFLKAAKDFAPYNYIEKKPDVIFRAEGFLFPDTYEVESTASVEKILDMMAVDFDSRLTKEIRQKAKDQNLSIYDLITLASLVEKEARFDEDRPIIAQVFFERLKIGMPLQTDASLQYLLDAPKEDVAISDTEIESPYNTYLHGGLPPGPIANPGIESILAVLNPSDTDYLYFVADRDGHNHYSHTYEEHLTLVNQYR